MVAVDYKEHKVVLMTTYGIRMHDRETEDDPHLATVMYSMNGANGPWHDMATGHPDWCWEILEALEIVEEQKVERVRLEHERIQKEIAMSDRVRETENNNE